jgi:hypothetical protein
VVGWFFAPHYYRLLEAADTITYLVLLWLTCELHFRLLSEAARKERHA